jgi:hypothetical protein
MATPNEYIPGQVVVLTDTITNPATAALTNDASDTLTVYKPDGTTTSPAVTNMSTGVYSAQITVDQAGWWEYVFKSTGTAAGAGRSRFYVSQVP